MGPEFGNFEPGIGPDLAAAPGGLGGNFDVVHSPELPGCLDIAAGVDDGARRHPKRSLYVRAFRSTRHHEPAA